MITRRETARVLFGAATAAAVGGIGGPAAFAADKVIKVGLDLSLTGADSESAKRVEDGAQLAFDQVNAKGGINGWKIQAVPYDDGTATAGQYDPAQAATNARKMVADDKVLASIGPQMSGAAKAMAPIMSEGNVVIITPSATNPDLTNPQFAAQYMPGGKPVFFRTVATDAYQGPYMANYYADVLHVKSVYILDDSGAYGVGLADAFEAQAKKKGIKILGRDRLDPKAADYTTILTKIKSLNPDALYYGGVLQAGVKVAKQAYDIIPKMIKGGGDGLQAPEMLTAVGYPANQGWYCTVASPHVTGQKDMANWVKEFKTKFHADPEDYSVTSYDAAMVIIAAIKEVTAHGKSPTREGIRAAIESGKVNTLQGPIAFDKNGDMVDKTISVFQIDQNKSIPADNMDQFKYVGVAPST